MEIPKRCVELKANELEILVDLLNRAQRKGLGPVTWSPRGLTPLRQKLEAHSNALLSDMETLGSTLF
jgi:hypothetical protein